MSFTNDDILILAKAGFNANQIAALNNVQTTPAPTPAPTPDPTPAPTPAPTAPAQGATVDDVLKAINGLGATFQKGFIQNAEQPKPVTAESILAEIINPPTKKEDK